MALVGVLSRAPGPISLTRLAEQAGLHTASAHRILGALMAHGLVEKTGAGEYDLGVRWLEVGNRLRARLNIRQVAMPFMQQLAELTGETVNLIVRRGDEAVYVERVIRRADADPGGAGGRRARAAARHRRRQDLSRRGQRQRRDGLR